MTFLKPQIIPIPTVHDKLGNLSFVEAEQTAPFVIQRVYYIDSIPSDAVRGGHSHKTVNEMVIALRGGFTIELEDQSDSKTSYHLDSPHQALLVPQLYWRNLHSYVEGSICLVLASGRYDENEYLRSYEDFKSYRPATE